ncbi:MAG TPA: MMPL family transporter [Candidatus Saccharibacteria bacterium]|nr:MMPL family transporter [Candidatus Saccharibacteria bacterium]
MSKWWQKISTKYPNYVLISVTIIFIGLGWYASGLFGNLSNGNIGITEGTESSIAKEKLEENFGVSPSSQIILFERKDVLLGSANSASYQAEVLRILEPLKEKVNLITTYSNTKSNYFISKDKTSTYAVIAMDGSAKEIYKTLTDFVNKADQSKLKISVGGEAASIQQTVDTAESELIRTELFTLPILLILLVIFFKSVVAAFVPIIISLLTIIGAFAITNFVSNFLAIDTYAINVITILGIGLSIDYALLSVNRFREELEKSDVEQAVKTIVVTSGHTIIFSGVTVIACLLSLLVFPIEMMRNVAIGGASAVAMGVIITITILPSLLRLIGRHIDDLHLPIWKKSFNKSSQNIWEKIAKFTTYRPILTIVSGFTVVIILMLPLFKFSSGPMDENWLARNTSSHYVSNFLIDNFDVPTPELTALLIIPNGFNINERFDISCDLTNKINAISGVYKVVSPTPISKDLSCEKIKYLNSINMVPVELVSVINNNMREKAIKIDVIINDNIGTKVASNVLNEIKKIQPNYGELYVSGTLATYEDNNNIFFKSMPYSIAIIFISMLLILSISLKSIILPIQAIIVNSIALLVSISVIVGIFQLGWLSSITGWQTVSGINLSVLILFVSISFGLAMDYSVFLYSRMKETHKQTENPIKSIQNGVIKTGPIITAAAMALFVVAVGFSGSSILFMQIIGVGLSVAVLVDAFFVRLILVPSIMTIVGKVSWYYPKFLSRRKKK